MNKEYYLKFSVFYAPDADTGNMNISLRDSYNKDDLPTDESYTLVCDGAGITCSNHVAMSNSPSSYYSPTSPMIEAPLSYTGFILQVLKPQARFMGLEPMASELDHYPDNFILANDSIKCKKTGQICEIKPQVWKNTSTKIYFNGYAALVTEKSTIKCWEDESAQIKIITNGQDISSAELLRTKFFDSIGERPNHSYLGKIFWGSLKMIGGIKQISAGAVLCTGIATCILGAVIVGNGAITFTDGFRDFSSGFVTLGSEGNVDTQQVILDVTVGKIFSPEASVSVNNFLDEAYQINGYVGIPLSFVQIEYEQILVESMRTGTKNTVDKGMQIMSANKAAARQDWSGYGKLISDIPKSENITKDFSALSLSNMAQDQVESFVESTTKTMDTITSQERFDLVLQRENDWYIEIISGN